MQNPSSIPSPSHGRDELGNYSEFWISLRLTDGWRDTTAPCRESGCAGGEFWSDDFTVISDGAAGFSETLNAVRGSDMVRNPGGARG